MSKLVTKRFHLRKLPVPFAAEELLEEGKVPQRSRALFAGLSDGWYCFTPAAYEGSRSTFFVWKGIQYATPSEFGPRAWYFELGCYEHVETCGTKYPALRREVEERREVNRLLLQMEKFLQSETPFSLSVELQ